MEPSTKSETTRGFRASLPVMLGFIPFALVLGAQDSQKGFGAIEVPLIAGMNFGGGIRICRHSFIDSTSLGAAYCCQVISGELPSYPDGSSSCTLSPASSEKASPASFIFHVCESWAMTLADVLQISKRQISLPYLLGVSTVLYLTWVVFTWLEAAFGPMISNAEWYGSDMAFTAVFLVLLRDMWRGVRACRPWLNNLAVADLTFPFIPGAWYVAAGASAGLVAAFFLKDSHG